MKSHTNEMASLIMGMRAIYREGGNAMAWARANSRNAENSTVSTMVAYDMQAGSYVSRARSNPDYVHKWCGQIGELIRPYLEPGDHIMEVGVGEATTLTGVMNSLNSWDISMMGFDVSWSRIHVGRAWMAENQVNARLFVGDLFNIPMEDNSIDVIYTAHSLEPNGGKEELAIRELLRVARKAVVLIEPLYELAADEAKERMDEHGYVRNLKFTAEKLGAKVVEYGLLNVNSNSLNPSGVVLIAKEHSEKRVRREGWNSWQCPLTGTRLVEHGDLFYAEEVGIAYPVLRGIALLRSEHGVIASRMLV